MNQVLKVSNLKKSYGALSVINDLSLSIDEGELHAVIGPNGAGKTTFVSLLSGQVRADDGSIIFEGANINGMSMPQRSQLGICRSFQLVSILPKMTALENVALCVQAKSGSSFDILGKAANETALFDRAREHLSEVGIAAAGERPAQTLSHGERRQLEIAMALACSPKLLLLDEPLAGTSGPEAVQLMEVIRKLKGKLSILLIEHDIGAVFSLADRISVLVYGRIIASGSSDEIRSNHEVQKAYLGEGE